jgi:hypothetical protein
MTGGFIHSPRFDAAFVLAPPFIVAALALLLGHAGVGSAETPEWAWVVLVLAIDVAHVYSTLWKTYLDRAELARRRALYVLAPTLGFACAVVLYGLGEAVFWRALAYLAVFHFVRQQYGFFMLYRRAEGHGPQWSYRIDQAVIYLATLWPLAYWHAHQPRAFQWFMEGDFVEDAPRLMGAVEATSAWTFGGAVALYVVKELWRGRLASPKTAVLFGTALSWYVGIVRFDSDFLFTLTNVVAHGVPYVALIWAQGRRTAQRRLVRWFSAPLLPAFFGLLLVLAYVEEGLWDGLVWRERASVFPWSPALPNLDETPWLVLVVPLLALPQVTHYVLDGFIWRRER